MRLWQVAFQQRQTPRRAEVIGDSVAIPQHLEEFGTLCKQRRGPCELAVLDEHIRVRPEKSAKQRAVAVGCDAEFRTQPRLFTGGAGVHDPALPGGAGLGRTGVVVRDVVPGQSMHHLVMTHLQ